MCLTAHWTIEERISELEERVLENIQTEVQQGKRICNTEENIQGHETQLGKRFNICNCIFKI